MDLFTEVAIPTKSGGAPNPYTDVIAGLPVNTTARSFTLASSTEDAVLTDAVTAVRLLRAAGSKLDTPVTVRTLTTEPVKTGPAKTPTYSQTITFWTIPKKAGGGRKAKLAVAEPAAE